jgi:hypothetical protein
MSRYVHVKTCIRGSTYFVHLVVFLYNKNRSKINARSGQSNKREGELEESEPGGRLCLRDCVLGRERETTGRRPRKEQPPPPAGSLEVRGRAAPREVAGGAQAGGSRRSC